MTIPVANLNVADVTLYAEVLRIKDRAEAEASLLSNTQSKLDDILQAKAQSQLMMQKLSKENFQIADVRDGSKREEVENLLSNSRSLYNQASQNSSISLLDWIMINELLDSSQRQLERAVQVSQGGPYTPAPFSTIQASLPPSMRAALGVVATSVAVVTSVAAVTPVPAVTSVAAVASAAEAARTVHTESVTTTKCLRTTSNDSVGGLVAVGLAGGKSHSKHRLQAGRR